MKVEQEKEKKKIKADNKLHNLKMINGFEENKDDEHATQNFI